MPPLEVPTSTAFFRSLKYNSLAISSPCVSVLMPARSPAARSAQPSSVGASTLWPLARQPLENELPDPSALIRRRE